MKFWPGGIALIVFALILTPHITHAAPVIDFEALRSSGITFAGIEEGGACRVSGNCTIDELMQVFVNIANFILGTVGSLVLVVLVWGGFLWLTSAGNSERIQKGKTAMTGSLIGLLIIFGAYTTINFLTGALRGGTAGQTNKCELVSPAEGGHAGEGYACLDKTQVDSTYECLPNLCPGGENIQCCRGKTTE